MVEIKDIISLFGVIVALGLGVYNALRTRKVAHMVDSLLLDDKRWELLRTAVDIQTLRTRERTALQNLRFKMRIKMIELSGTNKSEVEKVIEKADHLITDLSTHITSDRDFVTSARELLTPVNPVPNLIQKVNSLLGEIKVRHSEALLQQAATDGFIMDAENLLAAAQL